MEGWWWKVGEWLELGRGTDRPWWSTVRRISGGMNETGGYHRFDARISLDWLG